MKTPDCVIWALTRKNNAHLVKFNGNQWTSHPLSVTNMHNASESASQLSVHGSHTADADRKKFKRHFTVTLRHAQRHGRKSIGKDSSSRLCHSELRMSKPMHKVAQAINGFTWQNDNQKRRAIRRLLRESRAQRQHV